MKVLPGYPKYASGNCDMVTKRARIEGDEKVVVLDVAVEDLPVGTACLSSRTVEMMVKKLGWELKTAEDRQELETTRRELAAALERLDAYSELLVALERVFALPAEDEPALEVVK